MPEAPVAPGDSRSVRDYTLLKFPPDPSRRCAECFEDCTSFHIELSYQAGRQIFYCPTHGLEAAYRLRELIFSKE